VYADVLAGVQSIVKWLDVAADNVIKKVVAKLGEGGFAGARTIFQQHAVDEVFVVKQSIQRFSGWHNGNCHIRLAPCKDDSGCFGLGAFGPANDRTRRLSSRFLFQIWSKYGDIEVE
jgi:hypothetical protein